MPKIFGAKNLSADEIAVLLGFADAAAMVVAIGQYCVAGGTGDAITLTVPDWSEIDGAKLSFRVSGGNSGAVTIAVNGGTARDLRKSSQVSGIGALTGGELVGLHTVQWDSANSIFRLLNYRATKEDIPSTLNATTFAGDVTLSSGGSVQRSSATSSIELRGGTSNANGAIFQAWGDSSASYPGSSHIIACLDTRAASTAIALCPVATGDTARVEIQETMIAGCLAFVDAAGAVTLYSPIGGTVSASIVNSSSPGATEYGVYVSAGVLYFKGGSSYAGKMASFSQIGKA